jgi:hypothetical protein
MLNRDFDALTVNGLCDLTEKNILAGSPLTYGANGYKLAKAGDKFAGLSFNYYFVGKDDVNGGEWFADSKKVAVVKVAQVTLGGDEIDGTTVYPFVETDTYEAGDGLTINADGKLAKAGSDEDAVATVVKFDAQRALLTVYVNVK